MSRSASLGWILLGTALTVAAVLVWGAFVPAPHSGGDNAAYLALGHSLAEGGGYVDAFDPLRAPHTKYPPLFPLLLAGMIGLGATTWGAFKGLVAVTTVLGIGFAFLWAARRSGPWGGFAVAVLTALSAATVYYGHWILSDPLFVALTLAALWLLEGAEAHDWDLRWLAAGFAAALAAYFTRGAGLPLLVAVPAWLVLRRRARAAAAAALILGLPALLWWLRGRGTGVGDYASEFWLVDPYQPGLGTVGLGGLAGRMVDNAVAYLTRHVPAAVVGDQGPLILVAGIGLIAAALTGWALRLRERPGPAELFAPLYTGLILLWPAVWGGDRFVLPLLPLLFLYGAAAVDRLARGIGGGRRVLAAIAVVVIAVPALGTWFRSVGEARACAAVVAATGPFGCYGPRVKEFVDAAAWMGRALPEDAAVMTRKPRIFYVMSGIRSRTFPFDPSPEAQLAEADAVGARYVLLDRWDAQAGRFVGAAVRARPEAFCFIRGFGPEPGMGAQLLGILPPGARGSGSGDAAGGVALGRCPHEYGGGDADPGGQASSTSMRIPLLSSSAP